MPIEVIISLIPVSSVNALYKEMNGFLRIFTSPHFVGQCQLLIHNFSMVYKNFLDRCKQ